MFVPVAKRKWGYNVFRPLERGRFAGRIEAKADRAKGTLTVQNLWWEPRVHVTAQRLAKLDGELTLLARLAGVTRVVWNTQPAA
jgi:uncharacterized protein YcaQ